MICTDIVRAPESVPGDMEIITCFRFLLLSEPSLREACIRELAKKLGSEEHVMILGIHGNPHSRRALADLRNRIFRSGVSRLPSFSMKDMHNLATRCGLRVVGGTGLGYVPRSIAKWLPSGVLEWCEQFLADKPLLWRFGSNLIVICKRN